MAVNYSLPKPTPGTSRATSPTETEIAEDVSDTVADVGSRLDTLETDKAPLASPALTGTPTAPTAAPGTDTTQVATTEFVTDAIASGTSQVLLEESELSSAGTFDFTIPSGYDHLIIDVVCRSSRPANTSDGLNVTFNSDTAANYQWVLTQGTGTTTATVQGTATTSMQVAGCPAQSAAAGAAAAARILVHGYAAANLKMARCTSTYLRTLVSGGLYVDNGAGIWNSSAAITSVQIKTATGNPFDAGAKATVYGVKGTAPFT